MSTPTLERRHAVGHAGLLLAMVLVATTSVRLWAQDPAEDIDPDRAYIEFEPLVDSGNVPYWLDLPLYAMPVQTATPAITVRPKGIAIDGRVTCIWRREVAEAGDLTPECPRAPFHISDLRRWSVIEIDRVDDVWIEVRYGGRPYYLSRRSLPREPKTLRHRYSIHPPKRSRPLVGVIDIPTLFRPARRVRPAVLLRSEPQPEGTVVTTIHSEADIDSRGLGSGTNAAAVYDRVGRWSLVRAIDGRMGWLAPADAGKYVSLARLLGNNSFSTYLTRADIVLLKGPGSTQRVAVPRGPLRAWVGHLDLPAEKTDEMVPFFESPSRTHVPAGLIGDGGAYNRFQTLDVPVAGTRSRSTSVIVFDRRPGWLQVGLRRTFDGPNATRVWIEDAKPLWTVNDAPRSPDANRILDESWGPEGGHAATVLDAQHVNGALWLEVEIRMAEGGCAEAIFDVPRVVIARGWIKAHDADGSPLVWYETYCD
jgi:hypothetical protein